MSGLPMLQIPGVPGGPEVLIILGIIVLLFGADKIPELAGALGEARAEFDKSRVEVENELSQMQEQGNNTQSGAGTSEPTISSESTEAETRTQTAENNSPTVNKTTTEGENDQ
jgi:sec-independent protein translocase protein TatA